MKIIVQYVSTFAIIVMLSTVCAESFIDIHQNHHIVVLKTKKKQFCYISFIEVDGTLLLVKQKRYKGNLLASVHDTLAATIAETLGIAHRVALIPAYKRFPGKVFDGWPATVHTIAPGKTIKHQKRSGYYPMNIKQANTGFRRDMITWMAKHPDLIKIIALDLFLCNHDRHRNNLFYDGKNDHFCAIDMDLLFEYNLPSYAHYNLTHMENLFPLTVKEVFALLELRKALLLLVKTHTSDKTLALFNQLLQEAGLKDDLYLENEKVNNHIDLSRLLIVQSYYDIKVLINVLHDIISTAIDLMPVLKNFQAIEDFQKEI